MQHHESFRAMDTEIDLIVESASIPLEAGISLRLLFEQQEQRFSRFRATSLLSRLNAGEAVTDALFAAACRLALEANGFSGGLYNPMVLPALEQAGYATTFRDVTGGEPVATDVPRASDCLVVEGDRVTLRDGALDLGGIVKGWTVDLGIELLQVRYPNMVINAGGDARCAGRDDGQDGWEMEIEGEPGSAPAWQGLLRGALATSSTRKRRWRTAAGGEAHHLIDPRTGVPAESPFVQVSVWAPETWRAECWAKAVLIGGEDEARRAAKAGYAVLAVGSDGGVREW
jgi:thiamine biosynthesis lipoprotein